MILSRPFHEILHLAITPRLIEPIARRLGVQSDTIRAWRREPPNDDNPHGSGARSPLHRTATIIEEVHQDSPSDARMIANSFVELCDGLDERRRRERRRQSGDLTEAVAINLKEQSEALVLLIKGEITQETLREVDEAVQAVTNLRELVKEHLREGRAERIIHGSSTSPGHSTGIRH
ncbi:MAG: hypothetical protein K1Y36_30685 [Blastocatellia bacterium]|nr:hypothetical protein [Blastocatellia bacterium]